jgi:putative phosphoribosyl transferase
VEHVASVERVELQRRERMYRGERRPLDVPGRTVIVVDDGIATGSTMRAAIAALRKLGPARIVVAAGVASLSTSLLLSAEADEVVCPLTPREFRAVALFYDDFPQLSDADVRDYLERAEQHRAPAAT